MTRTKLITAAIAALALPFMASAATLTLSVENIETHQGQLRVGIFNADGYGPGEAVTGVDIVVDGSTVTATIDDLPEGEYGIKLYHDVNDDGKMGTNPFGMPTEPYAFSNSAKGSFGPAKWDAAKFTVSGEAATHTISMK